MKKIEQVAVYAASSSKVAPIHFEMTRALGAVLAEANIRVVYGGGGSGLMGCIADSVLEHGGYIKGIIPGFMRVVEWQHNSLSDLEIVEDMHERKAKFLRNTDAVIALPGGCGTLEELLEVITLKRLGKFRGPIVLINVEGYYDDLLAMLDKCIKDNFMAERHRNIWTVIQHPNDLIRAMRETVNWEDYHINQAGV